MCDINIIYGLFKDVEKIVSCICLEAETNQKYPLVQQD